MDVSMGEIFVNDDIDAEGNRRFTSLWVFTPTQALEAQLSAESGNQLDGSPLRGRVVHWVLRTEDFDLIHPTPHSRAAVEMWFADELLGELRATGPNCARLSEILRKYIVPNTGGE
jgi:hypothetical protein